MKILKFPILLLLLVGLASCHKDDSTITEGETTTFTPEVMVATTGSILGYVYDDNNNPVGGASVTVLGESTTTDQYGVYRLDNIELDQQGSYIKVRKPGYMLGSDMIFATEGTQHVSRVQLLSLSADGSISAATGGVVNAVGGGTVTFAPNGIVTATGVDYSGQVTVTAKRLATDDPQLADRMPGGLVATDASGTTVVLGSLGMIAVELRDDNGNELQLKEGSPATVTFPIAEDQRSVAPETIELWSFDEDKGLWIEEGLATKEGNEYVAQVSHFSFWNCDAPFPLVNICGQVSYEDGSPASLLSVRITADGLGTAFGYTNYDGTFGGKVPKNTLLTIKIYSTYCGDEEFITSIEVGPLTNKTTLDEIILDVPDELSLTGTVECSGQPVAEGTVVIKVNDFTYIATTDANGNYSLQSLGFCDEPTVEIFAVDPTTGLASATQSVTAPASDIVLQVCNDCDFGVEIVLDNTADICIEKRLSAIVTGSGNYEYLWNNGSTEPTTAVTTSGQYCVTVTDVDLNCQQAACSPQGYYSPFVVYFAQEEVAICGGTEATIDIWVAGGDAPYEIVWSSPDVTVTGNAGADSLIVSTVTNPGTYTFTVTDANGCVQEGTTTVTEESSISLFLDGYDDCEGYFLTANPTGGAPPYSYTWNNGQSTESSIYAWQGGEYCVTVSDANGCTAEACEVVFYEPQWSQIILTYEGCDKGNVSVNYTHINNYSIEFNFNGMTIPAVSGETVTFDLIPTGFNTYYLQGILPELGCEVWELELRVPHIQRQNNAFTSEATEPTCDTCDDGAIITNDAYLDYVERDGAEIGSILVIDANYDDVSAAASAGTLVSGTYYVIVTDLNTGCYIYSETVQL